MQTVLTTAFWTCSPSPLRHCHKLDTSRHTNCPVSFNFRIQMQPQKEVNSFWIRDANSFWASDSRMSPVIRAGFAMLQPLTSLLPNTCHIPGPPQAHTLLFPGPCHKSQEKRGFCQILLGNLYLSVQRSPLKCRGVDYLSTGGRKTHVTMLTLRRDVKWGNLKMVWKISSCKTHPRRPNSKLLSFPIWGCAPPRQRQRYSQVFFSSHHSIVWEAQGHGNELKFSMQESLFMLGSLKILMALGRKIFKTPSLLLGSLHGYFHLYKKQAQKATVWCGNVLPLSTTEINDQARCRARASKTLYISGIRVI